MRFQRGLILALLSGKDLKQVKTEGYAKARELLIEAIRKVMEGEVSVGDLAVSRVLRRPLSSYDWAAAYVSVAMRLAEKGKMVKAGEIVEFVHVDSRNHNPLCRVAPMETYEGRGYDREKYRELLLDAAETVLSILGFSRHEFGSRTRKETYRDLPLSEMSN